MIYLFTICHSYIYTEINFYSISARTVQVTHGYDDSDMENQFFPDPKPDYSDDDFEPKQSPKKKGASVLTSVFVNMLL